MTYLEPLLAFVRAISAVGLLLVPVSKGRSVAWLGLLVLFLVTWPPLDWIFSRPLEIWYPTRLPDPKGDPQAIVVPSSSVGSPQRERPYTSDYQTYQRCEFAA